MSSLCGESAKSTTSRRSRSATACAGSSPTRLSSDDDTAVVEHPPAVAALQHAVGERHEQLAALEDVLLGDVGHLVHHAEQQLRHADPAYRPGPRRSRTARGGRR